MNNKIRLLSCSERYRNFHGVVYKKNTIDYGKTYLFNFFFHLEQRFEDINISPFTLRKNVKRTSFEYSAIYKI